MGVCKNAEITVSCDPAAVASARSWALAELRSMYTAVGGEKSLDIQTVVSELVTNAVRARCSRLTLALVAHHTYVRVASNDDASGIPVKQDTSQVRNNGRGLVIVDALCTRWGVHPGNAGKTVWADVPLGDDPGPTFACQA
jgi:anti-sigma regulatory factor (Ser/Thr protein kinase)